MLAEKPKVSTHVRHTESDYIVAQWSLTHTFQNSVAEKRKRLEAECMRLWDENERLKQEEASRSEQIKQQEKAIDQINGLYALAKQKLPSREDKAKIAETLERWKRFLEL